MSSRRIIEAFDAWAAEGRQLVLATVCETIGSTYSKAGHRIIIADNGDFQGLVSGGCLEGDLAEHAQQVIADGTPQLVTYDLRDEADEIWGLGIGCNGLMRILLQRLEPASDYEPFRAIAECQRNGPAADSIVIIESHIDGVPPGATALVIAESTRAWGLPDTMIAQLAASLRDAQPANVLALVHAGQSCRAICTPLRPLLRLLIIGAGPDALPLLRLAHEMGWRVDLADHRPAYLASESFALAENRIEARPEHLASQLQLDHYNAVVVMSHHLASDRAYLAQLADCRIPYIGLLGPRARRDRLLADLGGLATQLTGRLHAPVGLDIGAGSPEAIALAIVAEIQSASADSAGSGC